MSSRTVADARRWTDQGTELFLATLGRLDDDDLDLPTDLPGWTRRQLVAHVASNAEALNRLVTWAATGVETPMYVSPDQRAADIDAGALLEPTALRERVTMTARQLAAAVDALTDEACARRVRTAQGRVVPATEIPWLRAREVCVHAVDLAGSGSASVSFPDLPAGFTAALVEDVTALRSSRGDGPALSLRATDAATTWTVRGAGRPRELTGTVSGLAAWLTGRGDDVHTADSEPLPALPRWL